MGLLQNGEVLQQPRSMILFLVLILQTGKDALVGFLEDLL